MFGYLPRYCERTDPGLWGEPLNLVSNLAFLLAAVWLARTPQWRHATPPAHLLRAWIAVIGLGSALWHATAKPWALWADVVPIAAFMAAYPAFFLRHVAGFSRRAVFAALGLFAGIEAILAAVFSLHALNGAVLYPPAVVAVGAMAIWLRWRQWPEWRSFALAAALLAGAIAARVVDLDLCLRIPHGTHFLWHLLAAWALFLLVAAAVSATRRAAGEDRPR
jgi:hypothetical protein